MGKVEEAKALEKKLEEEYLAAHKAANTEPEEPAEVIEEEEVNTADEQSKEATPDEEVETVDTADAVSDETPSEEAELRHAALQLEYDKLKRTHSVLEGKYNAEVPKLAAELREMKATQVEALRQARNASFEGDLSKIKEEHGEEIARLLKASLQNNEPVEIDSTDFDSKLAVLENKLEENKTKVFLSDLRGLFPDAARTQADPKWLQWLAANGYQELVDVATEERNAEGLANVLKLYALQTATERKASQPAKQAVNKEKLEGKVEPNKSVSGSVLKEQTDAPLTEKEIIKLQRKAEKLGRSSNRAKRAEADKILNKLMTQLSA